MNKIKLLIILFFILLLQGCNIELDDGDNIVSPNNPNIAIQGKWKIKDKTYVKDDSLKNNQSNISNKKVIFSDKYIYINNKLIENPEYKSKNVNTKEYLLYNYKIDMDVLKIDSENINVLIVTSGNNYLFDIVYKDDKNILMYYSGMFLHLEKISNDTDINIDDNEDTGYINEESDLYNNLASGVLLGLRSHDTKNSDGKYTYRTLWISSENKKLNPILELNNLFIPRKNGFWNMKINSTSSADTLSINPIEDNINKSLEIKERKDLDKEKKVIQFVSDDYVITEYAKVNDLDNSAPRFRVLPLDNINSSQGVFLKDIYIENGKEAYNNSAKAFLVSKGQEELKNKQVNINEQSFTMTRRNGYWILKGRLFYMMEGKENYKDFNINILPTEELIKYNDLLLSWNYIKSRVPQAIDAYTSPNKDLAIIITEYEIYIFYIENNLLSSKPIKIIEKRNQEEVIMAEWSTNNYVDLWNDKIKEELK
ncbi:hypothetical protein [Senegalia massiliensis]|uniref:Lipoprotein n=1 Tax=Senegalia massiliensis TaxID=1720316 RepID=A0A845QZN8_9CLOT|nr:hypothetical protein [Senegalia massiliensis]NBI07781.1 hypothetical protein [Senegalia massiliensis]